MSHLHLKKPKLLARVRRLKGQLAAIEQALEAEAPCGEILNQVASVKGAVAGLTAELLEDHVRAHVVAVADPAERAKGGEELIDVIRSYLR